MRVSRCNTLPSEIFPKPLGFLARVRNRKTVVFLEFHQRYELMTEPIGKWGCETEKPRRSGGRAVGRSAWLGITA